MTAKRFTLTATDYIYDTQDKAICPTLESVVTLLNELHEENTQIKSTIKEAYENERTMIGKSVLKQLMETIQ